MAIDAADFCLAILDRGTPLGVAGLLSRARKYKLGLQDYDVRRALRALRDLKFVSQSRTSYSSALIFTTTPEGSLRAKKHRQLVKKVFKRYINESNRVKKKPEMSNAETICTDCGNPGHTSATCTFGR